MDYRHHSRAVSSAHREANSDCYQVCGTRGACSINDIAIREHIIKLLEHELTLIQFRQWFFESTWNAEDDIVYSIKLLFAEYSHGDWTEEEMREMLKTELEKATIGEKPSAQIKTGTSSVTKEKEA